MAAAAAAAVPRAEEREAGGRDAGMGGMEDDASRGSAVEDKEAPLVPVLAAAGGTLFCCGSCNCPTEESGQGTDVVILETG